VTSTVAVPLAVPPAPAQLSVKVVFAVNAALVTGPPLLLAVSLPDHVELLGLAEAVQLVAF
jgi:hypothetical protein